MGFFYCMDLVLSMQGDLTCAMCPFVCFYGICHLKLKATNFWQPSLVEDIPAYGSRVGTRWSLRCLPTQINLSFLGMIWDIALVSWGQLFWLCLLLAYCYMFFEVGSSFYNVFQLFWS